MRINWLTIVIFFLLVGASSVYGALRVDFSQKDRAVFVDNSREVKDVVGYLVFWDMDADEGLGEPEYISYVAGKWRNGLFPISEKAFDAVVVKHLKIADKTPECPQGHRCFLGAALVPLQGKSSDIEISLYPMNFEAALERLKGQWLFATDAPYVGLDSLDEMLVPSVSQEASPIGTEEKPNSTNSEKEVPVTEKPDIYRLSGNMLLYANTAAGLFEVISLASPEAPVIKGSISIPGEIREVYELNGYYVVLSGGDTNTTILTMKLWERGIEVVDSLTLDRGFRESRRRDNLIFVVAGGRLYSEPWIMDATPKSIIDEGAIIEAVRVSGDGRLEKVDTAIIPTPPTKIAIFKDWLVTVHEPDVLDSGEILRAYPIGDPEDPIGKAREVLVNGTIPSDLHIDCRVRNGKDVLVFVARPLWSSSHEGSSLYVYDLDSGRMITALSGIAPGEELYATVFSADRAYVVTYERKDPLWVIDLSMPEEPKIVGELEVPGWSEKLFFHEDRLLAAGYMDIDSNAMRASLVSIGLFDVSNPEKPRLVSRITPFDGVVQSSYSEALYDERALNLDWNQGILAFPLETWQAGAGHWVQAIGIDKDGLEDLGHAALPFRAERTFWFDQGAYLAAFSPRELVTFKPGDGDIGTFSRIPLVTAVDMLESSREGRLVGVSVTGETVYRLYVFDTRSLIETGKADESILEDIPIPTGFSNAIIAGNGRSVLFYNLFPFRFIVYSEGAGLRGPFELEKKDEIASIPGCSMYDPLFSGELAVIPFYCYTPDSKDVLVWNDLPFYAVKIVNFSDLEKKTETGFPFITVPGKPVALDDKGRLVTVEDFRTDTGDFAVRVNLLEVSDSTISLLDTVVLDHWPSNCGGLEAVMAGDSLFIQCKGPLWYPSPMSVDSEAKGYSLKGKDAQLDELTERTVIYEVSVSDEGLMLPRRFFFDGLYSLVKVEPKSRLAIFMKDFSPFVPASSRMVAPFSQNRCVIFDLSGDEPELVGQINTNYCYDRRRLAITPDGGVFIAAGERGVAYDRCYKTN
ncbi:hypothetical protein DBT_0638 [Dissulfuribacter thermophilus]|uniref:Uncharacterized protein n=1 Tax=Dissulfuribacter thermophilus TaxID=1156395 RepID=A0A1B9F8D0_9BACT|nr:beta-propeller domain-containing protein [Dissulfuribacter thermophilus]OCC16176.1 hypothetical protein DBT_0638 [Dissulfuribacter thermophilus]